MKSVQIRSYFCSIFSCIQPESRKIRTRNNSVFGHFNYKYSKKYGIGLYASIRCNTQRWNSSVQLTQFRRMFYLWWIQGAETAARGVLWKRCSQKFRKIHRKSPVPRHSEFCKISREFCKNILGTAFNTSGGCFRSYWFAKNFCGKVTFSLKILVIDRSYDDNALFQSNLFSP